MQVANYKPQKGIFRLTYRDSVSCYPIDDTTGTAGAFTFSFAASCPNYVYSLASSPNQLGTWSGLSVGVSNGVNAQCENAFRDYKHGFVRYAKIELVATPTLATQDSWKWTSEADIILTLSKTPQPWSSSTTIAGLTNTRDMLSGRNTVTGNTSKQSGGPARGCKLTGVYQPRRLYNSRDLEDRTAFDFGTQSDYTMVPSPPSSSAYWNVVIVPKAPYYDKAGVGWTMGVPLPHRLDVKITYICAMIDPASAESDNAPMGPI